MAVNRDKLLASAQKHVRKGNWDRAIKDYRKVVDEDPSDVRTLLKVADLHVKLGEFEEALHAYQTVAYHYAQQDIYEKAVAVYKQALRVAPDNARLHRDLGEAYFRHGRLKDALRAFHKAQKLFRGEGDGANQRDVLERMIGIDADDMGLHIQLAERYEKDGGRDKALEHFRTASDQLFEEGRLDEFVQVAERIVFLSPNEVELRKQIVRIYLDRNDNKHALKHLQLLFKERPEDIETLEMLGQTFARLGSKDKAVMVYQELARAFYKNGYEQRTLDTYRKILKLDPNHQEARSVLGEDARERSDSNPGAHDTGNLEQPQDTDALDGIEFLDDDDDDFVHDPDPSKDFEQPVRAAPSQNDFMDFTDDLGEIGSEALSRLDDNPATGLVARELTQASTDASDIEDLPEVQIEEVAEADPTQDEVLQTSSEVNQSLTECEVFFKYGLLDRAEAVLTQLVATAPNNIGVREQMLRYCRLREDDDGSATQLFQLARITASTPQRAKQYLKEALQIVDIDIVEQRALQLGISLDAETLPPEASVEELDLNFIEEVSEGIDEASEVVIAEDPAPSVVEFLPLDDDEDDDVLELEDFDDLNDLYASRDEILADAAASIEEEAPFTQEIPELQDHTIPEGHIAAEDVAAFEQRDETTPELEVPDAIREAGEQTDEENEAGHQLEESSVSVIAPIDITQDDVDESDEVAASDESDMYEIDLLGDDDLEFVEDGEIELLESSELDEVEELSLDDVEEMEIDVDDLEFSDEDFAIFEGEEVDENFDFNFTSDDADKMFSDLFGGDDDGEGDAFDNMFGGGGGLGDEASEDLSELAEIDFYIEQELISEAEDAMERFVDENPDHEGLAGRVSKIAVLRKRFNGAAAPANEFGAESLSRRFSPEYTTMAGELRPPELMNTNIELGQDYFERGMVDEAIDEFKQALDDPEVKDDALYKIGICELERGDIQEAESVFETLANKEGISDHIRRSALDHLDEIQRERA